MNIIKQIRSGVLIILIMTMFISCQERVTVSTINAQCEYSMDLGLFGSKTVLRMLTKYEYAENAYKMATKTDALSWDMEYTRLYNVG